MPAAVADLRAGHAGLSDRAYRVLRELIVSRALAAGEKVTAERLAQRRYITRSRDVILETMAANGEVL